MMTQPHVQWKSRHLHRTVVCDRKLRPVRNSEKCWAYEPKKAIETAARRETNFADLGGNGVSRNVATPEITRGDVDW